MSRTNNPLAKTICPELRSCNLITAGFFLLGQSIYRSIMNELNTIEYAKLWEIIFLSYPNDNNSLARIISKYNVEMREGVLLHN